MILYRCISGVSVTTEGGGRCSIKIDLLQSEALATFARVDFWCFVELMFPVLYPGQELVYAGYLELIATLLMGVAKRKYRNVVINLPPRHMKSALASILYPAWRLGCDPTVKFICISYGDDLAHDLSAQTRKIMRSPLYKDFPGTVLDKNAMDYIRTTWADIATPPPSAAISPAFADGERAAAILVCARANAESVGVVGRHAFRLTVRADPVDKSSPLLLRLGQCAIKVWDETPSGRAPISALRQLLRVKEPAERMTLRETRKWTTP